jgi:hypothetical protein
MALGATPASLRCLVLAESAKLGLFGLAPGITRGRLSLPPQGPACDDKTLTSSTSGKVPVPSDDKTSDDKTSEAAEIRAGVDCANIRC